FPKIGKPIKYCYLFLTLCKENHQESIKDIIDEISDIAESKGYSFIIAGAMENDPIIKEMRKFKSLELSSKIFIVDWNNDIDINEIKNNKYHLEISLL
ncbi:hypothetical protein KAU15_05130, partial [candidate division WOR-3 bacterium]|nr:hypothetical protein [candidate division WOR-3 bacterium]